jgi:hypothetical protein
MEEWFFFYRIRVDRTRISVCQAIKGAVFVNSGSTYAAVSWSQNATIGTNAANYFFSRYFFIEITLMGPFPEFLGCISLEHTTSDIIGDGSFRYGSGQWPLRLTGKSRRKKSSAAINELAS